MVSALAGHLSGLAKDTDHNWTMIRVVAGFVFAIIVIGFGLLIKFLVKSRTSLHKQVQEHKMRPNHLQIEMPALPAPRQQQQQQLA